MARLRNLTTGEVIASKIEPAKTFWKRTKGLMMRDQIESDEGLWIDDCSAVHTIGMLSKIDIFFLDKDGTVLKIVRAAAPQSVSYSCMRAQIVVETGVSTHRGHDVLIGDRLTLE